MNTHFKKFLIKNLIATLAIILFGALLFSKFLFKYFHLFYLLTVLVTFFVNLIVYYIVTKKSVGSDKSLIVVVKSFAIKFFSYLTIALVFLLIVKTQELRVAFVILLFLLYLIYTYLEIASLIRFFKTQKD